MSRHCSRVSPDIQDDVSGPIFQRMPELVKNLDEMTLDPWFR